ncbi:MAG: hypothetical protein AB8H86_10190 [Polyangiales bacterium]
MRAVHFYSLSAHEQSEFIAATDARSPLFITAFQTRLSSGVSRQVSALLAVGALVSLAALFAALAFGFASSRNWGQADLGFLALYGGLFGAFAFAALSLAKSRARGPLPYITGTYVLTADVVVAKPDGTLTIFPLAESKVDLQEVKSRGERFSHLTLSYADTKMLFVEEDAALAAGYFDRIKTLRKAPETSLFGAGAQTTPEPAATLALGARGIALVLAAALLAVPTWYARNYFSDEALFAHIQGSSDLQLMHRYAVESNSPHAAAARELWMERQFEEAGDSSASLVALAQSYPEFARGSWSERVRERRFELAQGHGRHPLIAFTEAYPDHAAGAAALQAVLVDYTRSVNSMSALRSFVAAYPEAPESADFRARIAQRYREASAAASAAPEETRALLEALLAFSREHQDSELRVRFSPPRYYETTRIDRRHRNDRYPNRYERLTPHMSAARCRHREEWFVEELNRRISVHYPGGVLFASYVEHLPPGVPTLDVSYAIVPYGLAQVIDDHIFERVHFDYALTFRVPGHPPYRLEFRTNAADESPVESDHDYPPPRFYDEEARRALQQLGRVAVEGIFGKDYSEARAIPLEEPVKE